jgi:hypothetical protein
MNDQINKIQKKLAKKGKKDVHIKKVQNVWILSQNGTKGPVNLFNQRAWESFVEEVLSDTNDDVVNDLWL